MSSADKAPTPIDLSHHLSDISKARELSPLKGFQKYVRPGQLSLAGGLPSALYFPYAQLSATALVHDAFSTRQDTPEASTLSRFWRWLAGNDVPRTTTIHVDKFPSRPGELNLAQSLQYSPANGILQLQNILTEFTANVFQPGFKFSVLLTTGNSDGWVKAALTLCNPGDGFLADVWTYPSALVSVKPYGIVPVPVGMDGQGMRSDLLRTLLENWKEEEHNGMKRPHVLYTIPIGQNPTGATVGIERKKEIYDVCVEFDVIIVEDDPYYFLQEGPYVSKEHRVTQAESDDPAKFITSLESSYLRVDYQGRVIRLDTFSKTIAPGCRLGWFTCAPLFAERLERQSEASTQAPCGFAQTLVTSLLLKWEYSGYVRWLQGLRFQYQQRRDFFVDCLADEFHLKLGATDNGVRQGCSIYDAYLVPQPSIFGLSEKTSGNKVFSFVPPTSGMFVWLQLHLTDHPHFSEVGESTLEVRLWIALADAGVLFGPGHYFAARSIDDEDEVNGNAHFRISFSDLKPEDMKKAVRIFGTVLRKFMKGL